MKNPSPFSRNPTRNCRKLDKQMQALEGVRLLKKEAQKRIEEILAEVWGE